MSSTLNSLEIILRPNTSIVRRALIFFVGTSVVSVFGFFLIQEIPSKPIYIALFILLFISAFMSIVISYRITRSLFKRTWLRITKTGITDTFGLLSLKDILNYDVERISVKKIASQSFLIADISLQSGVFKDLDEPKGLLVDFYNLIFKGQLAWPLYFFDLNIADLETKISGLNEHYKEHKESLSNSQIGMSAKPLMVSAFTRTPEPKEFPDKPSLPEKEAPIKDNVSQESVITGFMELFKKEALPMDIPSKAEVNESMDFAKDLCEIYFDCLRSMASWATCPDSITHIKVESVTEDEEYACFTYSEKEWKIGIEMTPNRDRSLLHVYCDLRKVFTCEVSIEIGTLEPVKIVQSAPGPWQSDLIQLIAFLEKSPLRSLS